MEDPELVCSDWFKEADVWQQLSVDGVAKNGIVNVLIWSSASLPVQHNDIYADDSCFEILPVPGAKGICRGAGYVPTGDKVLPLPPDYAVLKITAADQKGLPRHGAVPTQASTTTTNLQSVRAPSGNAPAVSRQAR